MLISVLAAVFLQPTHPGLGSAESQRPQQSHEHSYDPSDPLTLQSSVFAPQYRIILFAMKTSASILIAASALVGCASSASLVQMRVQYSEAMVNVGNLDIFGATWSKIYATSGNDKGAINDDTYETYSMLCKPAEEPQTDLKVRMEMNGAWGANDETGIAATQMRDAIVQSAWAAFNELAIAKRYDVYSNCRGFTWQESVSYVDTAACGGTGDSIDCPAACESEMVQCLDHTYGLYLPSSLRVSAYLDDELMADSITFTLSTTAAEGFDDGCGIVGTIAENLAGFIPVVGSLFAAGISFECS